MSSPAGLTVALMLLATLSSTRAGDTQSLVRELLRVSTPLIRPVVNQSEPVAVRMRLGLIEIAQVDTKEQNMKIKGEILMEWKDENLMWKPQEYGGTDKVKLPANRFWAPDIVLQNAVSSDSVSRDSGNFIVHHDGAVSWERWATMTVSCTMDVEYFPYDLQRCEFRFTSQGHHSEELALSHASSEKGKEADVVNSAVDLHSYYSNTAWNLVDTSAHLTSLFFVCCSETYQTLVFNLTLRRRSGDALYLLLPPIALGLLAVIVAFLAPSCGERLTVPAACLLGLLFFHLHLSTLLPMSDFAWPLIVKYNIFCVAVVVAGVLLTVMLRELGRRTGSVSDGCLKVIGQLGCLVCGGKSDDSEEGRNWEYLSQALSRLLGIIYAIVFLVGTCVILLNHP